MSKYNSLQLDFLPISVVERIFEYLEPHTQYCYSVEDGINFYAPLMHTTRANRALLMNYLRRKCATHERFCMNHADDEIKCACDRRAITFAENNYRTPPDIIRGKSKEIKITLHATQEIDRATIRSLRFPDEIDEYATSSESETDSSSDDDSPRAGDHRVVYKSDRRLFYTHGPITNIAGESEEELKKLQFHYGTKADGAWSSHGTQTGFKRMPHDQYKQMLSIILNRSGRNGLLTGISYAFRRTFTSAMDQTAQVPHGNMARDDTEPYTAQVVKWSTSARHDITENMSTDWLGRNGEVYAYADVGMVEDHIVGVKLYKIKPTLIE